MINCIGCKYYVPDEAAIERRRKGKKGNGRCHRYAPRVTTFTNNFPTVDDNEFCGDGAK
jgi:hypothetical protein